MKNSFEDKLEQVKQQSSKEITPQAAVSSNSDIFSFVNPVEVVDIPSKGKFYPDGHPLKDKESVEIRQMTAKEEDILTNQNYISKGIVLDKLLEALTLGKIDIKDLITGDKNAILIASRILGYGKDYTFKYNYNGQEVEASVDLSTLQEKQLDETLLKKGTNDFSFTLPKSGNVITFKLLTHGDEKKIDAEIKGLQKVNPNTTTDVTTRMKYIITSVNGSREQKDIREFVDNYLLAVEARALREYYSKVSPDIDLKYYPEDADYTGEGITIPIGVNFFWPDAGV